MKFTENLSVMIETSHRRIEGSLGDIEPGCKVTWVLYLRLAIHKWNIASPVTLSSALHMSAAQVAVAHGPRPQLERFARLLPQTSALAWDRLVGGQAPCIMWDGLLCTDGGSRALLVDCSNDSTWF